MGDRSGLVDGCTSGESTDRSTLSLPGHQQKLVEALGFQISEIEIINDTDIEIVAVQQSGKWRNIRQTNRVIRIIRTTDTLQESFLRKIHQGLKQKNATRAMIISAGDFSTQAMDFANTRPIEILGKNELINLLKKT